MPATPLFASSLRPVALLLAGLVAAGSVIAQTRGCGGLANGYGPFDYRDWKDMPQIDPVTNQMSPLQMVEGAHFTEECEALIKCKRGSIGADLDYTLRAFPNHHRALLAMMLYADRKRAAQAPDALFTVDCYFKRALTWRPDDVIARLIYVTYLKDKKRLPEARENLQDAAKRVGDNPFTVYNLGMVAMDLNEVDMAVDAARRSYGAGMTHPVLRQRLLAINRWPGDQVIGAAPAASAAAASASAAVPAPASAPASAAASSPATPASSAPATPAASVPAAPPAPGASR